MTDLFGFISKYPLDAFSHLIILLPIVTGFIHYTLLQKGPQIFIFYFLSVFIKESVGLYTALHGTANLYLQNSQSVIDIGFIGLAFYSSLYNSKLKSNLLYTLIACLLASLASFKTDVISPINQIAGKLFCIITALFFFTDTLRGLRIVNLTIYPAFWLGSGTLLYGAGTFLITLFGQVLVSSSTSEDTFEFFWNTQQLIYCMFCVFATVGFWVSRYEKHQAAE